MDWNTKLESLERVAKQLEPDGPARTGLTDLAVAHAENFLEKLPGGQAFTEDQGKSDLLDGLIKETATPMEELLETLDVAVDQSNINPASGGHLGYIPGGGIFPAALGDFLADVTNRYSGIHYASPGAAKMEQQLVSWMTGLIGFPAAAGGDLTSGGSTANLAGIVTARDASGLRARDYENSCIYMTRQVHHCVDKAIRVSGLEECNIRFVPMDERHRMDASVLNEMIASDKSNGLKPWLVVASAGTTDSGAVDPFLRIGAIVKEHNLWLHVDAAYGGFFILCSEGAEALQGLNQADSIVIDPHKGLFLPYGTGAVLVKNVHLLAKAHRFSADYLQDAKNSGFGYSPADLSVELSRPFRGLRLWLPLKLFGLSPFRAALEEKIWLARYFHERMSAIDGFETGPYPDLSVVTFRYVPRQGNVDEINAQLLKAIHDDGRIFISSTMLDGCFTLRVAILHFRTHREEVDYLINFLVAETQA